MKLAVAATPRVALPTLDALFTSDHQLAQIITKQDKPAGRGKKIRESAVSGWARERGISCEKPSNTEELAAKLSGIDVLITIGFGLILPKKILDIPKNCSINLHFSLLPRWRGAAPVQRAIEAGDSVSGVTVFQLDEGMDTGPIYLSKRFALDGDITGDELLDELALMGPESVIESLKMIESGIVPTPQSSNEITVATKLSKEEAQIKWDETAETIHRKIRAFTSVPGAWTLFRGQPITLQGPQYADLHITPGQLQTLNKKLYVGTGSSALSVELVKPSGKPMMTTSDWINGIRLVQGESFGS